MHRILICVLILLVVSGRCDHQELPDGNGSPASCCPQEMCFYIFDRLEEQMQRWKSVEQALRQTVSLLSSTERLTDVGAALKADPVISALFKLEEYSNDSDSTNWEVEPIVEIHRSQQNMTQSRSFGRTKRQTNTNNNGILSAKEKLFEALNSAKKGTTPSPIQQETKNSGKPSTPQPPIPLVRAETTTIASSIVTTVAPSRPPLKEQEKPLFATQQFVRETVGNLQGAAKCALAQQDDANFTESLGVFGASKAILQPNGTITLDFELKSCHKYFTAVYIRLYEAPVVYSLQKATNSRGSSSFLQVPKDCLKKIRNIFSLTLPSSRETCSFPLMALMECKVYNIEMTPIYQGFQGRQTIVDITVPPKLSGNSTNLSSVKAQSSYSTPSRINLQWSVNSADCAQLVTSVEVRVYEDVGTTAPQQSYTVPSSCFTSITDNQFYIDENAHPCYTVPGKSLEMCRTYKVELQPKYSSVWEGKSSMIDLYTTGTYGSGTTCHFLSSSTGSFISVDEDGTYDSSWFISVEPNNTIWIVFSQFYVESSYYRVKVFDGPSNSSRLLLEQYRDQPSKAVRSSTNKVLVQLVSQPYYKEQYGKQFKAYYTAVPKTDEAPYVAGCGGYIKFVDAAEIAGGKTIWNKPVDVTSGPRASVCLWYIESSNIEETILLTNPQRKSSLPMIVYDGWSEDNVVYDQSSSNGSSRAVVYANSNKMMVKFPAWNTTDRENSYSWNADIASRQVNGNLCLFNLTAHTGTIKSVNYPLPYSGSFDCRWTIQVNKSSKVQLTFVISDTEPDYDFVTVYDGLTVEAPVLTEISGTMTSPVTATSTSHQMTVRFTAARMDQPSNDNVWTITPSYDYYMYNKSVSTTPVPTWLRGYGRQNGTSSQRPYSDNKGRSGFLALYSSVHGI